MQNLAARVFLTSVLYSTACIGADLVGSVVPPFPEGVSHEGGACISHALGVERVCDYSIGLLQTPGGRFFMLGKSAPRVETTKARWLVTDQMPYPKTQTGEQVLFSLCERNGVFDATIIAVVETRDTDTEWYSAVREAFQANLKTERFETIPPTGIRCVNEGWGL